ncbi:hypothetical protein [Bernardetia sp. MNP-M8]|uniref:hypothetical protein n=1 Tax=Bernardetia sp. MNP-M8 TaxID=3127470 RepID=UPI0030D353E7
MFDTLKINTDKLPISEEERKHFNSNEIDWQTKDLDSLLAVYEITDDGKLFLIKAGWTQEKEIEEKKVYFHGILNFYGDVGKDWYEFYAKFTDGQLIEITGHKEDR